MDFQATLKGLLYEAVVVPWGLYGMVSLFFLHCENSTAPRLSTKESGSASLDRKKDRARSKSPFRSFRWKKGSKSPTAGAGAHSDDEANLERAAGEVLDLRL